MNQQALGLIEAVGLPAAIEAADAALKSANVTLLGYQKAKGGGLICVKIRGDVGAVKAAVEAGVAVALRVGKVRSCHVIPRPHSDTEALIDDVDTGPAGARAAGTLASQIPHPPAPITTPPETRPAPAPGFLPPSSVTAGHSLFSVDASPQGAADAEGKSAGVCNLCGDPTCPRRKGQPHKDCIHSAESGRREER